MVRKERKSTKIKGEVPDTMQKIKKIWNVMTTVLVGAVVVLAVLLWGAKLIGLDVLVVQSGSMEPAYPVGSLVYVQKVDPAELTVGDVITFELGGGVRGTHRIMEIVQDGDELAFVTKGDANEEADISPVRIQNLVGQVKFTIPMLGFLVAYIQHPPGIYMAGSTAAVLLLLTILPDLIFPEKEADKKEEETV